VCQVPPGKFWELNVVRDGPKGLYRPNFVHTDNKTAISCLSCPEGWTTAATTTPAVGMCNGEQQQLPAAVAYMAPATWQRGLCSSSTSTSLELRALAPAVQLLC
jgi:hypothetical protein